MLVVKTYVCKQAQLSFNYQIEIDGVKTNHSFVMESNNTCEVIDPVKQEAIENSKYFKSGWLTIKSEKEPTEAELYTYNKVKLKEKKIVDLALTSPEKAEKVQEKAQIKVVNETLTDANAELDKAVENELAEVKIVEFPEVKTVQEAKDVLRSEPYNVAFQRLNNPESIAKVAEELGIKFPNL